MILSNLTREQVNLFTELVRAQLDNLNYDLERMPKGELGSHTAHLIRRNIEEYAELYRILISPRV